MVVLGSQNKITDFLMILAWASPFKKKKLKLCAEQWSEAVNKVGARSGNGNNKLRTYCKFKNIFQTEFYVGNIMTRSHRLALAKFRCGVAPFA